MKPFLSRYTELGEFLDERPDAAADWKPLALLLLAGFGVTVCVRLLEALNWAGPQFFVGGERLLATHDAYCWLAGAKGVNEYASFGMSGLARALAAVSGAPLWAVGFWSPPFLASLTAVATGLWAWRLGGLRAAILPACLGALAPGFFYRSRLGYFDSDVFTLLVPLALGLCLATLLERCCSRAWLASDAEREHAPCLPASLPWLALGFGLLGRVAHFAHDDIHALGIALFWLALGLATVTGLPGRRVPALRLLTIYALAAYAGPRRFGLEVFQPGLAGLLGLALALGLAWLVWRISAPLAAAQSRPAWLDGLAAWLDRPWPWLALLAALTLACGLLLPLGGFWAKALSYFKPVSETAAGVQGPSYPGITQSIREAKNMADVAAFFAGTSVSSVTGALGALGALAVLLLRPAALLLLPLIVLGFASLVLGARFTMFAGPVFALGLGLGLHWTGRLLSRRLGRGESLLGWAQALAAAACLLVGYVPRYLTATATPIISTAHAQALQQLKDAAQRDAEVWTWWDFGYATQYFAERRTPTDGGKHSGRDVFATALALTTASPAQAARLIQLSAGQGNDPARRWDAMSARDVAAELEALKAESPPPAAAGPAGPQYLVVCWENMPLLYWISFYGTWDVAAGTGEHARMMVLREPFSVDKENGKLLFTAKGTSLSLASADLLTDTGAQRLEVAGHSGGAHLLINDVSQQAILLDDLAYNSMAVQLLIGDPRDAGQARFFKLVHEGFPLVRIYEVLAPASEPAAQAKAKQK